MDAIFGVRWQECNEIIPGVFLGPLESRKYVQDLLIDMVFSFLSPNEREFMTVDDLPEGMIEHQFELVDSFIEYEAFVNIVTNVINKIFSDKRTLFHCSLGKSRSVSMVAAYLTLRGICSNIGESLELIKKARPCIQLNQTFFKYLIRMEDEGYFNK
jgi:hypothetical protein